MYGIQPSTSVSDFIGSLPKMRRRRIWKVMIDGVCVQCVSATDNLKSTAERYIAGKYPGQTFRLVFAEWRM